MFETDFEKNCDKKLIIIWTILKPSIGAYIYISKKNNYCVHIYLRFVYYF